MRLLNNDTNSAALLQKGDISIWTKNEQPKNEESAMPKKQPGLPRNRAFVVQLHAAANVDKGEVQGRIEHVASAQSAHFQSVEELVAFMVQVLIEQCADC